MLEKEIYTLNKFLNWGNIDGRVIGAWERIKKFIDEALMEDGVKQWTAQKMGRKGGKASRRTLTPEQARAMVEAREAKRKTARTEVNNAE